MEDAIKIKGIWGKEVILQSDDSDTLLIEVDRCGAEITKKQALELGEWLIEKSK